MRRTDQFDVLRLAKQRRYRVRNLHDGYPVPPARLSKKRVPLRPKSCSGLDRWPAIVGKHGYIAQVERQLSVFGFWRSRRAKTEAFKRCPDLLPFIDQEGDTEIGLTCDTCHIEAVLRLIQPYRRRPVTEADRMRGREMARVRHKMKALD